jgi:hypothetical protein
MVQNTIKSNILRQIRRLYKFKVINIKEIMNQVVELKDIFTFIKEYNLTFDITSKWFQDLWYPLSKSQPPAGG